MKEFGKCKDCNRWEVLKNGYCSNCQDKKMDLPPGFEEIFDFGDRGNE